MLYKCGICGFISSDKSRADPRNHFPECAEEMWEEKQRSLVRERISDDW